MPDHAGQARFGAETFAFVSVVDHALGGGSVVLCRLESGELRYVSAEEWEAAAILVTAAPMEPGVSARPRAPVTRESPIDDKIALIMSLFKGRADVYGEGYVGDGTKEGKLNYWPRCALRWAGRSCPKNVRRGFRCSDCDHPSYAPLSPEVVKAHCQGLRDKRGRIQAIGIYVVEGDACRLLAADFDGPGWQEAASAYRDACRRHGLTPAVERSRSGNGAHVWVFFKDAVKAELARRVGEGLVSEARDSCTAVSFHAYDRLFPLQDSVGEGDLGSLIALPLQGEAVRKGNSVFVDDQFVAQPDQCAYLSSLPKASPDLIATLADEFGKDPIGLPDGTSARLPVAMETAGSEPVTETCVDMPATVPVTLSNGIRIRRDGLPARVINRLRRLAAFRNPEYTKKLRMHYSVWETPRFIELGELEGDELVLPRGCADAALTVLREAGARPLLSDERADGRPIHARFLGELRPTQVPCRDHLVPHELGVLVAPTGFGKSVVAASIIAAHQVSTLVIVPSTALLMQWRHSLSTFLAIDDEPPVLLTPTGRRCKRQPGTVGVIGDGKRLRSGIVDVALAGSLFEKGPVPGDEVVSPLVGEYGMVIVDEAQHVAAAKVLEALRAVRARHVYAMTATPKRPDGLDRILFLECGPLRHEVAVADQVAEQGMRRLLVPRFSTARPNLREASTWHALVDYIGTSEERNRLVATDAARVMRLGRTPLVLTRRVEHARTLAKLVEAETRPERARVALLVGGDPEPVRRQRLEELRLVPSGSPLCVVATGPYVGEGFDLDRLDTVLLAGPVAFESTLDQWVGRLHRTREGKADVVVMDYVDPGIPMFDNEWRKRLREYRRLGYEMADEAGMGRVGLDAGKGPTGSLFAGKEFVKAFESDLVECRERVVIASSWVRAARVEALRAVLAEAIGRGVVVDVVLREPTRASEEWDRSREMLCGLGCQVCPATESMPLDCAVIDGALAWYGGVAPLAHPRRGDSSLRLANREVAAALTQALE